MAKNLAEFITEASGNYISKLGLNGDFSEFTSVAGHSPLFGCVLSDWVISAWEKNGFPNPVQLVELGPGTGVMMKTILENIEKKSPKMFDALRVVFLEHPKELIEVQQKNLADYSKKKDIKWISDIREMPMLPFILIANEFFNCLPIHQVVNTDAGLRERMVENNKFILGDDEPSYLIPYMAREHLKADPSGIIEVCPYAVAIISFIAERMNSTKSSAIVLDFGYVEPQAIETLQAVKDNKYYPVLETAGDAEITAQVDFSALRSAALQGRAKVYGPLKQNLWFKQMGLVEKANDLLATMTSDDDKKTAQEAYDRLVNEKKTGVEARIMMFFSRF